VSCPSGKLDKASGAFNSQSECLEVGEVIVLFKGRLIFSQSLLKMYAYKDLQIEFF
jgi:hypothetical protein